MDRYSSGTISLRIVEESFVGHRQVTATARRRGISRSMLTVWRRQYRWCELGGGPPPAFIPVTLSDEVAAPTTLAPVPSNLKAMVEIALRNGPQLVVPAGAKAWIAGAVKDMRPTVWDGAWARWHCRTNKGSGEILCRRDLLLLRSGHKSAFTRFLEDGRVCPTNNCAERSLRSVALGRRSWLFAGSKRGGHRAAFICSLIGSTKLNGIDPQARLADVIKRIIAHQKNG